MAFQSAFQLLTDLLQWEFWGVGRENNGFLFFERVDKISYNM